MSQPRSSPRARSRPWASRCCWASPRPRLATDSLPVGRLLPGDHQGAHRRRHRGQDRPLGRPQGERHHRQAHPGGHGPASLPRRAPDLQGPPRRPGDGRHAARLRAGSAARHRGSAAPAAGLVARRRGLPQHGLQLRQLLQRAFAGASRAQPVRRGGAPVHLRRPGRVAALGQQVLARRASRRWPTWWATRKKTCCASRASA